MRFFGLNITRDSAPASTQKELSAPNNGRGGWYSWLIREPFTGAWQRNLEELGPDACSAFHAVFSCHTLICSDIAKLRAKLVRLNDGVWQETSNAAYSPVLRKPNHFQTRIQFWESWINSKLARGNTYALKRRDGRGVVTALYVLNPDRVQPLVSDDGAVFYRLCKDNLAALQEDDVVVPAREIIHDRFNCLFHPLVGISPLYASALAATHGTNIQRAGARLAANGVRPSGILTAPGRVNPDDAARMKEVWETQYAGASGASKVAVLGDGLKFESLTMKAEEAQLVEQLRYTAEVVCSVYHVPGYKVGVGQMPNFSNVQSLNVEYYSQCLQVLIEAAELCLDEGLGIGEGVSIGYEQAVYGVEFDTDNLLRMDSVGQMDVVEKSRNVLTLDERRQKLGAGKITGGQTVYMQIQDHSIEAIAARDAQLIDQAGNPEEQPPAATNDDDAAEAPDA